MRLFIRHAIAALLFFFVVRLALQAQEQRTQGHLPKAVMLSRLSDGDGIPSENYDKTELLQAIQSDSARFIHSQASSQYR